MKTVSLHDLKEMGKSGGYVLQVDKHFPLRVGLGYLKKDWLEFRRIGFIDGRPQEVVLREPYTRDWLEVIKSIKHHNELVAYRYRDGDLCFTDKEAPYVI